MRIILASGSPRRKQLMELAGLPCEVLVTNADETINGPPTEQVSGLALRKLEAARDKLEAVHDMAENEPAIIIAADTLVYVDGEVLGKPENKEEAFQMLKTLSGRKHTVYTGVAVGKTGSGPIKIVSTTDVWFRRLSDEEINAYINTGEPFDKAGAYGVQERGAVLVDRVDGDFYTVVGLPISKVWSALLEMGYNPW